MNAGGPGLPWVSADLKVPCACAAQGGGAGRGARRRRRLPAGRVCRGRPAPPAADRPGWRAVQVPPCAAAALLVLLHLLLPVPPPWPLLLLLLRWVFSHLLVPLHQATRHPETRLSACLPDSSVSRQVLGRAPHQRPGVQDSAGHVRLRAGLHGGGAFDHAGPWRVPGGAAGAEPGPQRASAQARPVSRVLGSGVSGSRAWGWEIKCSTWCQLMRLQAVGGRPECCPV